MKWASLYSTLYERIKENGDMSDPEEKKWMEQMLWNAML